MTRFFRFAAAPILALTSLLPAPVAGAEFELVGREMTRLLQNGHYARLPFDERMSERFLERYLNTLDASKSYFLQSEVNQYQFKYGRKLHDLITQKKVLPVASEIYEIYRSRVAERVTYVQKLIKEEVFDFQSDRAAVTDRSKESWPTDIDSLHEVWRNEVEESLLSEKLRRKKLTDRARTMGKKVPFKNEITPEEKISLRYTRLLKSVQDSNHEDIANDFFSAVTKAYDPHSEYLSAGELEQFKIDISNELVGIGARLKMNDLGETEIKGIVNGGPADTQGNLKLGDRVIAVSKDNDSDWIDIVYKPMDKVIENILGKEGSKVGLRIKRGLGEAEETLEIEIERGIVTMKDDLVTAEIFEYGEGEEMTKLAVMRIPSFYFDFDDGGNRVSVDVERILKRIKKENVDGLALDLRGNGGGSLPEVNRMTGFFVGRGPVVQVKSINGHIQPLNSSHRRPIYDGPLVVLTDKYSASATEILAGALQDYNRAVIVGSSSTFGKGTVQKPMDIAAYMPVMTDRERAGWLKLTFQKYYRVSGSSVQIKGVVPDIILPAMSDAYERGEGYRKYALPHDVIGKAAGLKSRDRQELFMPLLLEKSGKRVADEQYFKYLREDIDRAKAAVRKNAVSLNEGERLTELKEDELRRETRRAERRKRFAEIEAKDQKTFKAFRLTLDTLKANPLPKVDREKEGDQYVRSLADETDDLTETLKWPSGIDAVKREGMHILRDLVDATKAGKIAGVIR